MIFGIILGAALVVTVVWLIFGIWRIGAVSDGEQIEARRGTALLLIDLQTVFWERGPYPESVKSKAKVAILDEVRSAKANGDPVIAARQKWSIPSTKAVARLLMKGQAVEGTKGTELAEPFVDLVDHVLIKRVQDAFETGQLDPLLAKLSVGRLRLVGLDLNHCVKRTALAARARGYDVTVVIEGTLSATPTTRAQTDLVKHGVVLE